MTFADTAAPDYVVPRLIAGNAQALGGVRARHARGVAGEEPPARARGAARVRAVRAAEREGAADGGIGRAHRAASTSGRCAPASTRRRRSTWRRWTNWRRCARGTRGSRGTSARPASSATASSRRDARKARISAGSPCGAASLTSSAASNQFLFIFHSSLLLRLLAPVSPLLVIFLTVFIDLLGFGIIIPLLPFYAEHFGASALMVGLLSTSFSLAQFLFAPFWGRLSDRIGRRPVILLGPARIGRVCTRSSRWRRRSRRCSWPARSRASPARTSRRRRRSSPTRRRPRRARGAWASSARPSAWGSSSARPSAGS